MAKTYPAWQWLLAAAFALVLGVTYTVVLFSPLLGPGMLLLGAYLGWRAWKASQAEKVAAAARPAP